MKIEKLTENKIRIILRKEDFKDKTINLQKLILNNSESSSLFLEILNKAEKEVDFNTNGHKLLIETYMQGEDMCVFTITKYIEDNINSTNTKKRHLIVKRKTQTLNNSSIISQFNEFEDFCNFCDFINKNHTINLKGLFKSCVLYNYNNSYYLIINGINLSHASLNSFYSSMSEFSSLLKYNRNFKFKLMEHGKVIIKNNAINTGIKYFTYKTK